MIGALGPYVNLKIEPGTQVTPSFPSCTGFVADATGAIFDAALSTFPTTYAGGISDYPGIIGDQVGQHRRRRLPRHGDPLSERTRLGAGRDDRLAHHPLGSPQPVGRRQCRPCE